MANDVYLAISLEAVLESIELELARIIDNLIERLEKVKKLIGSDVDVQVSMSSDFDGCTDYTFCFDLYLMETNKKRRRGLYKRLRTKSK